MAKLMYKPLGAVASVVGGVLAGAAFKRVWKLFAHEEEAPRAIEAGRGWSEVLAAAALEGAIFGLVKAAAGRAGAVGFQRATGSWPG
jgi:hypothetical protein